MPQNIVLFGIEPKKLTTGLDLSAQVSQKIDSLVEMVAKEIRAIGIEVELKD